MFQNICDDCFFHYEGKWSSEKEHISTPILIISSDEEDNDDGKKEANSNSSMKFLM